MLTGIKYPVVINREIKISNCGKIARLYDMSSCYRHLKDIIHAVTVIVII